MLKLQCRYVTSVDLYKYELFDVTDEVHLETVISSHYLNRNVVMELYVEFARLMDLAHLRPPLRIDDLLFLTGICEGTSNPLLEGGNEGADEEEDVVDE
ncbi:hypothetical protein PVK06_034617 [Gossypium arboreum]|uniref:Uncharacterized protein n=1 Tax=Gossypium arboreum TaxID=29729 RepID=A0ABR0NF98_GOSAR|nr:hypothetical protein PVK06_034617 [Gossypium arboreum]